MGEAEKQLERLKIDEIDAWFEYLETTKGLSRFRYSETEPWAWRRLANRLKAIRRERKKVQSLAV